MKDKIMELNKETAMMLWSKRYGKEIKVTDFAGREIAKAAYNNRDSKYGWNVDHILPQSRGGKTAEHNLVICHIKTNDEKADKFPAFKANDTLFEIIKVENHYEIREKGNNNAHKKNNEVNFFDSADGIRFFNRLQNADRSQWIGSIDIELNSGCDRAMVDFIKQIFDSEKVEACFPTIPKTLAEAAFAPSSGVPRKRNTHIYVISDNLPDQEDIQALLDKCILLNTYLQNYFLPKEICKGYRIYYRVDEYEDKAEAEVSEPYFPNETMTFSEISQLNKSSNMNTLFINELVYINTDAEEQEPDIQFNNSSEFKIFDYYFTKLSNNLRKEIEK